MQFDKDFVVASVRDETPDVKTFVIRARLYFIPGQYVVATMPATELQGEERPFTLASAPCQTTVCLTIKRIGKVTSWMHANLRKGSLVHLCSS